MNCQLAAYIGDGDLNKILLDSIKEQEPLFGGHATGMGVINDKVIDIVKGPGHVEYVKKTTRIEKLTGTCGLAHARYSDNAKDIDGYNLAVMAHPYISDDGRIALMHNGNITNYKELWKMLREEHTFRSWGEKVDDITDSEVAVHMLSDAYNEDMTIIEAFQHIAPRLTGTFLLAAITIEEPDTVYICNWHQPCYIGFGSDEAMFVSSRRGLKGVKMDRVFAPPKNSILKLTRKRVEVEVMDTKRKVPRSTMNEFKAKRLIVDACKEQGELDVRKLAKKLDPEGWAEVYDVSSEDWLSYRKAGVYIMNPYFELLESMVKDGLLVESIDPRQEGGIEGVPRYSYKLA